MNNILLLGLVSLLTDFSSEMIMPILPFFITALGGAGVALGLIIGIGDAVAATFKIISGRFADRTRRYLSFVALGYGFSAAAKFLFPFAQNWQQILIARPLERIGKGFRDAPRDAIVSESLDHKKLGLGFGIQRAMDSVGAIFGSITILILFWYFELSFRSIFLVAAIIGVFAVLPIFFVKVPPKLGLHISGGEFKHKLSGEIKKFIFISTLFALANFSFLFFILKTQQNFSNLGQRNSVILALLLYALFNIFDAGFSKFAGSLSDRIGRKPVILMAYLIFIFTSVGFILAQNFILFLVLFAFYGLFKAFIDASQRAFVSDLSDPEIRGTALGVFEMFTGLAAIPSGLIAGVLWNFNSVTPFIYGSGLAFYAFLLLNSFSTKSQNTQRG